MEADNVSFNTNKDGLVEVSKQHFEIIAVAT